MDQANTKIFSYRTKTYYVDFMDFLIDPEQWDENFAEGMALRVQITQGLTQAHWQLIRYVRDFFAKTGQRPLVFQTCRDNGINLRDLKGLFPSGYWRGVCRLAGMTSQQGHVRLARIPEGERGLGTVGKKEKGYRIDVHGYLMDSSEWDENLALNRAAEMKMAVPLTERHWQIIRYLRDYYQEHGAIPTIFETCETNEVELEELEQLFPDGYQRGAVKIAGLRAR